MATPASACAISLLAAAGHEPMPALGGPRRPHRLAHQRRARAAAPRRASAPAAAARPRARTPSASSSFLRPNCGMLGMRPARSRPSSPRRATGRAPAAPGRRSAGRPPRSAARVTAGTLLMTPATITGAPGGYSPAAAAPAPAPGACRAASCETRPCSVEMRRPGLGHDRQELRASCSQCSANVVGHQRLHARGIDILDLHRVHQPGELARQPGRLRGVRAPSTGDVRPRPRSPRTTP